MRVIALKTLREYGERVPEASTSLYAWYHEVEAAEWKTPADIKEKYRSASILKGGRVVFNIAGNKYRLVVGVNYEIGIVFIKFVGTHAEYDKINAEEVQYDGD
ncbi:MAG: type II toxin-antitoxin system HigB family toxin [Alphaproteobacteria bacterium]